MNRRSKGSGRKLIFEPKVPEKKPEDIPKAVLEQEKPVEKEHDVAQITKSLRGLFAPQTFGSSQSFDLQSTTGFVLSIPEHFSGASIVLFSDGTLGIRHEGKIYDCDSSFIGESLAVELKDKAKIIGRSSFLVTGYTKQQSDDT